jgi:CHAT domain-containing protein
LQELAGANQEAEESYIRAADNLESLRGSIRLDELRMSFGTDKYQVYENIVNLKLNRGDKYSAFDYVERSKSRTLIDLLERNLETVWRAGTEGSPRLQKVRKLREELNVLYNRLDSDMPNTRAPISSQTTRDEIISRERELIETLRDSDSESSGWSSLQSIPLTRVQDVQSMLDPDELLIEYYSIGDRFQAIVIGKTEFQVFRDLTRTGAIRSALKGLKFQLSKFHLQQEYLEKHAASLLTAANHHLQDLYRHLIEPLKSALSLTPKLIVVPHQALHYVPFHALYDGRNYMVDNHDVSYAASASVLRICREKKTNKTPEVRFDSCRCGRVHPVYQ